MKEIEIRVPESAVPKSGPYKCKCMEEGVNLSGKKGKVFWIAALNDNVKEGELLCEIELRKKVFEILSPCDGTLARIDMEDGDECEGGSLLGIIAQT